MNHAAVSVNDKIFSFGGYCTGDNYKDIRPIDIFVLNTGSVGVQLNFGFILLKFLFVSPNTCMQNNDVKSKS